MVVARTLRLTVDSQARPETLPLGPQEYFVLSRVEGRPTVAEVIAACGLPATQTEQALARLLELGALRRVDEPAASLAAASPAPGAASPRRPRVRQSTQELRAQAQERRRRVLQQQLVLGRTGTPTPSPSSFDVRRSEPEPGCRAPAAPEPEPELEDEPRPTVTPVPADDPRVDRSLGLGVDDQRWLLALEDRLEQLTPFELLELRPTHDLKVVRGAFRDASRRLHPDAYHGRELGRFRGLLSMLFGRAKAAHAALQSEEIRAPLVEAAEAARAERRRLARLRAEQQQAALEAAEARRRRREQEAEAERRASLAEQRAERERERLAAVVQAKVAEYLQAAADAEAMENYARAANNYRLAMELHPHDAELRARWAETRTIARRRRAKDAFARACTFVEAGHPHDAVPLFLEAADADPTVAHLAHAADAVREHDPPRARDLAMGALRLLSEGEHGDAPLRPSVVADLRLMIGRAFLAAGQAESAREQARLVQRLRPGDPQARALLNSAKVT